MADTDRNASSGSVATKARFGTFGGVFVPNVLTILGIIFFLRTGWVVGQAGLTQALIIVGLASLISFLTGLSLSAVATNMHVKTGGAYYMLTRTLGIETGGAIGIPLFLSQAIAVAFYIIGFTEALTWILPGADAYRQLISTGIVILFGALAFAGADFVLKIQYGILALLMVAIGSFFAGSWDTPVAPAWDPPEAAQYSFWAIFAIFFPAVTGITVGASMSGDLKNPAKSIPRGTLWSIALTTLIYFGAILWLGTHATRDELIDNHMIMQKIAAWPGLKLILIGVWAATLSSALGSVLAAPRTLQALATDGVVPKILTHQLGSPTEPRLAVIVTAGIAVAMVWMGNLNFVATVITMFFLSTYGMLNLAAGLEVLVGNPSYRPKFKLHWSFSIFGGMACYGAMFLINVYATLVVIAVSGGIFLLLQRRSLKSEWSDIRSGIWFTVARHSLLKLEAAPREAKNWRPNVIVFTGQPSNREHLVEVGEWLTAGRGIVTFVQILIGDTQEIAERGLREAGRARIQAFIRERGVNAFAECEVAENFAEGAVMVAQAHGMAGLEPNTVLAGLSRTPQGLVEQVKLLPVFSALRKSVLLLKYDEERGYGERKQIDIWWGGRGRNAELMLMMAHIVSQHPLWSGAKIRLLQVVNSEEGREPATKQLQRILEEVRVRGEAVAVLRLDTGGENSIRDTISQASRGASLTIMGMQLPGDEAPEQVAARIGTLVAPLGSVMLVRSAETEDVLTSGTRIIARP